MRKNGLRIASLLMAATLVAGCGASDKELTKTSEVSSSLEEIVTVASVSKASASNPNSTVYVVTGADGEVEKVFDDDESDIPVDIKITYTLDGSVISPKDLAGKSGHVTIRFDYTNNSFEYVDLNGTSEKIYVPFTMVSGLLLDDKNFSNVTITNGKLIDDGNRTIALGLAFPGLKDNLNLASYDYNVTVPEYVEVSADVTNFSLDMTLSIATNEIFSEIDTEDITTVDELKDSLDELNDAMEQILDGSAKLYEGLDTLYSKVGELSDGVDKLYDGSSKLADGASTLADGAATLSGGAKELSDGLATLASNNDTLNSAAKQVFEALLSTANTQLAASGLNVNLTIENYATVLNGIIAQLDPDAVYSQAYSTVEAGVDANSAAIEAGVTAAVRSNVEAGVTETVRGNVKSGIESQYGAAIRAQVEQEVRANAATPSVSENENTELSEEEINAAIDAAYNQAINQQVDAKMATAEIQATIAANTDAQMASEQTQAIIAANVASKRQELIDENMNGSEVQGAISSASSGLQAVKSLKTSLDSYNQFYTGLQTYTAGVAKASSGASSLYNGSVTLKDGANTLANGAKELNDGVKTLKDSMPQLTDGVSQLKDGAQALDEGLNLFNEEGIQKINEVVADDVETLIDRFKATVDVSKNFKTTSGSDENSSIKFIFRSEAID